jgi:tyrosyl-tRNA synthetase
VKVKKVKDKGDPEKRAAAAAAAAARKGLVAQPDGHVEGPGAEKAIVGPSVDETLKSLKVADS